MGILCRVIAPLFPYPGFPLCSLELPQTYLKMSSANVLPRARKSEGTEGSGSPPGGPQAAARWGVARRP